MVLQQDKGSAPLPFDTGLPRTQFSEDVPRWLVILGMVAACTLLVALLRYAIDLLGVVFLIILVGFSIRAVSDWLTEGESVSAWALAAVFAGLFGTVLVGLWLFGSRDMTSGALERGVPTPVLAVADWLESHGWGQRVLLGGGGGPTAPSTPATSAAQQSASASSGGAVSPRAETESPSGPGARPSGSQSSSPAKKAAPRAAIGEAEAATISPSGPQGRRPRESAAGGTESPAQDSASPAPVSEAVSQPAVEIGTSTSLSSSHSMSPVGTSVRFTATVTADGSGVPTGVVVFYDGDRAVGTAAVHGAGPSVTAVFSTLDLAIGDHQIAAEFRGSHGFLGSRSQTISQTIARR